MHVCLTGYWLKDGACTPLKQGCESNCELCEEGQRCKVCKEGCFMKKDGLSCGKCDVEHCLDCKDNGDTARCGECTSGFGAKDGRCIRCAEHCERCSEEGKCSEFDCEEGCFNNTPDEMCIK